MLKKPLHSKFRNISILLIGLLLSSNLATISEAATIKNGVSCKKAGQTTKSGAKRYVCGKNPYVSPTRLTWMLRECPQAYELYIDSKDQYEIFKDILSSSGAEGQAEAEKLVKAIDSLEALMRTKVCRRGA